MTFRKGYDPNRYVRPRDIPGAVIYKVTSAPIVTGNVWGMGGADDKWGGTFTHPMDITHAKSKEKVHPWAAL